MSAVAHQPNQIVVLGSTTPTSGAGSAPGGDVVVDPLPLAGIHLWATTGNVGSFPRVAGGQIRFSAGSTEPWLRLAAHAVLQYRLTEMFDSHMQASLLRNWTDRVALAHEAQADLCDEVGAITAEMQHRGVDAAVWDVARNAVEHELSRVSARLTRWSAQLVAAAEPGEEPLIAVDIVLRHRIDDDLALQSRLQREVESHLPSAVAALVVVTLLYSD